MKTKVLITMLVIMLCTAVFASEDSSDPAEQWRKTQELNERAARFKAETGFEGHIGYNLQSMQFSTISGNFMDIEVTAPQDTVFMRNVFDQVVSKVLPYISAREGQLIRRQLSKNIFGISVSYYQDVNGYPVFGAGSLKISYISQVKLFSIANSTVPILDDYVSPVLTNEDAIRIYAKTVPDDELLNLFSNRSPKFSLSYCNIHEYKFDIEPVYRLCWVGGSGRKLVIDSVSGEIYVNEPAVVHSLTVNTNGTALLDSDNNGNMDVSCKMFHDTRVYADCDGNGREQYTDIHGNTLFEGLVVSNIKAYLESSMITMFDGSSDLAPQFIKYPSDPLNPVITFDYYNYIGNPSNQYYHANKYIDWLCDSVFTNPFQYPQLGIITGCTMPEQGKYFHLDSVVKINHGSGMYNSTVCHEMTHALVYHQLNQNFFNPFPLNVQNEILYAGMDEAFSIYFPSAYRDDATYWWPLRTIELSDSLTVTSVYNNTEYTPSNTTLNEDFYSYYGCREPIASAWWDLRTRLGALTFDQMLTSVLANQIVSSFPDRYKPRYFYNILMSNSSHATQLIIDKAYSNRGLHFTPRVISAGSNNPNKEKNKFRIGDPVHVKITNCPQNTPLTVYIVEDQDYTDGMNISSLSILYSRSLSAVDIGDDGSWTGELCNSDSLGGGEYDILVDIGNNGVLHFAYNDANIRDGFDGLTGHGFTVYDDRIEVVTRDIPGISHR